MFFFKREQKEFDFGGVNIGGQPGQNPTVLVGGLFFRGQPIVERMKDGTFNSQMAKEWIDTGTSMSQQTGHPLIIQIFGQTPVAMERHITWLSEHFDGPFMFESTSAEARIRAIQLCNATGLQRRAIYNSINMSTKDNEVELLKASGIDKAVVLGWTPRATSITDRLTVINNMLERAKKAGIEKVLVDPATLPVGAGYGLEYRTLIAIKSELGLPTCLGPHNAPSAWRLLRRPGFDSEAAYLSAVVASTAVAQVFAADCIMYGSMARTSEVFTAVALIGNALATAAAEIHNAIGVEKPLFEPPTCD